MEKRLAIMPQWAAEMGLDNSSGRAAFLNYIDAFCILYFLFQKKAFLHSIAGSNLEGYIFSMFSPLPKKLNILDLVFYL